MLVCSFSIKATFREMNLWTCHEPRKVRALIDNVAVFDQNVNFFCRKRGRDRFEVGSLSNRI